MRENKGQAGDSEKDPETKLSVLGKLGAPNKMRELVNARWGENIGGCEVDLSAGERPKPGERHASDGCYPRRPSAEDKYTELAEHEGSCVCLNYIGSISR